MSHGAGDRSRSNTIIGKDGKIYSVDYAISFNNPHIPLERATVVREAFTKEAGEIEGLGKIYQRDPDALAG